MIRGLLRRLWLLCWLPSTPPNFRERSMRRTRWRFPTRCISQATTTYFCVVDGWGNAVSGIQSLANPFGAVCMDPATGVLLNSRMLWFHTDEEHPNAVAPGKHVRNTINPPLAVRNGSVRAVWGSPWWRCPSPAWYAIAVSSRWISTRLPSKLWSFPAGLIFSRGQPRCTLTGVRTVCRLSRTTERSFWRT